MAEEAVPGDQDSQIFKDILKEEKVVRSLQEGGIRLHRLPRRGEVRLALELSSETA